MFGGVELQGTSSCPSSYLIFQQPCEAKTITSNFCAQISDFIAMLPTQDGIDLLIHELSVSDIEKLLSILLGVMLAL